MNNEQDILDDRIDVVTRGLLGLTVTCARCHDHKFDPIPQNDYYSLYGVFASSVEPTVPPLFEQPPRTEVYAKFAKELETREQKLAEFVQAKHDELVKAAMTRVAEYLVAAHQLRDQPSTEEFMLLADGGDLNPKMLVRWQAYLQRTRKAHHAVFAPWHAFAALPEKDFAEKSVSLAARFADAPVPAHPINPLLARAFAAKPPRTLGEAAQRYGELLNDVEKRWQATVSQGKAMPGGKPPAALPDPTQEELRQVFHGPDGPPNIAMNPVGDLDLLPDRPSQAKLQELRKAVETWRATGPGAPPRAMALEDAPTPFEPRVFRRGNPNNLGEPVPRQFLQVLAGERRQPFHQGSGRLELAQAIVERGNPLTARVLVNRVWLPPLRQRVGPHPQRLRPAQRAAHAPGVARSPGHRLHGQRLGDQKAPPAHPAVRRLSAEERWSPRVRPSRPREQADMENEPPPARLRGHARCLACGRRQPGPGDRRPAGHGHDSPFRVPADGVRLHRPPKPAGAVPHLRFPQPGRDQPAARHDHGRTAGAVHDEQPVCHTEE